MQPEHVHPSDQELLMAADGELVERRASDVQGHLASCEACRGRMQEIESAMSSFTHLQQEIGVRLPNMDGPRALLRARLAELAAERPRSNWQGLFVRSSLAAAGLVVVLALGASLLRISRSPLQPDPGEAHLIPDSQLTPGAVVAFTREKEVCSVQPPKVRFISAALGERVFQEYGITRPRPRAYEVDYLIDPELGGSNDIQNLWPEPYSTTWNARVKDALEDRLHDLVCSGDLSLSEAQHEIATNWIAAYKKYFKTDMPLPAHFAFAKDQPWE
ncbi:MAG TPA: zf-HC2 domain-containing protein [Bryobacteraceae bacterium]|nr:zf-HC2 domain-containing protein [Bryobacteraceae bacterium]